MTDIWTAENGQLARRSGSGGGTTRPSGPGYVRYEDLYVAGDTVTQAMNRLTSPAIVTFPEGVFLLSDFQNFGGAINCNNTYVQGMIGSGSGTLFDESHGTIFKMVPNSSSFVTGTSPQTPSQAQGGTTQVWVIRSVGAAGDMTFENFQIIGTEQGHNYNGLYVFHPAGNATVRNVKVSGVPGDNGAPPGETFAMSIYQGNMGQALFENCETDGRRASGGEWFGAGGITTGQSIGAIFNSCTAHHNRTSSPAVFYKAFDGVMNNCVWGTTDAPIITNGNQPVSCVNHEVDSGIVHNNCTYYHPTPNHGTHITFSNNHETCQYTGWPVRSCVNGSLKVVNPTFNDVWGNGYFYVASWLSGTDGTTNDDSMTTAPLVTNADGVTHLPYKWSHGSSVTIT